MDPQQLLAQAEKKAASSGGFFSNFFGGGSMQLEDAADLYIQAANGFRLSKDMHRAGQAFEKAACVQKQGEARDDAANTLVDAYKAYRQSEPKDAARVLEEAVHLFTMRGQFRRAANYEMDLGTLYESELEDSARAIKAFENAGDWYFNDQAEALSNKAFLKVAELAALANDYQRAIENFERVARQSLNSNLSKYSLKDYFVRSTLCYMAQGDNVGASGALDRYLEWDSSFRTTKEFQFLCDLIDAVKQGDEQLFTDKLWEYDNYSKLDKWKVSLGLRIKETLQGTGDELL